MSEETFIQRRVSTRKRKQSGGDVARCQRKRCFPDHAVYDHCQVKKQNHSLSPTLNESDLELAGLDMEKLQKDYDSSKHKNFKNLEKADSHEQQLDDSDQLFNPNILDELFNEKSKCDANRRKASPSNKVKQEVSDCQMNLHTKEFVEASQSEASQSSFTRKCSVGIDDSVHLSSKLTESLDNSLPLFDDEIWPKSDDLLKAETCNKSVYKACDIFKPVIESESTEEPAGFESSVAVNKSIMSQKQLSVASRIRKSLQNNACSKTPQSRRVQKLRDENIKQAMIEADDVRQATVDWAVGPFYGLPSKVKDLFEKQRGIKSLYAWQDECLNMPAVCCGKNLIYSLPTSGGKTLVAEILMLQQILCHKKDAIIILPFVSIVQEKVRGLALFAVELDFLVEEYAASKGAFPPRHRKKRNSIYVATIEKSNNLISSFIEHNRLADIGLVVVDELHMLGEGGSRGATLEVALTKLLHSKDSPQVVGMSATLNNICDLTKFLNAELYTNDFRPVELVEYVKVEDNIFEVKKGALCPEETLNHSRFVTFPYSKQMRQRDPDHLLGLVLEVLPKFSCLVFCPTKKNCENVAEMLCELMPQGILDINMAEKKSLLKELYNDNNGKLCPVLQRTIAFGIAYHHSGLTTDERKLIEEAYSKGVLKLLACTSTLAAGVNLPAKRVILRSPHIGANLMSNSQYKQMVGRAGRAGIDSSGESILLVKSCDRRKILDVISGPFDSCYSSLLYDNGKGMRALILTLVGLKVANSTNSVLDFVNRTLYAVQHTDKQADIFQFTKDGLEQLMNLKLIKCSQESAPNGKKSYLTLDVTLLGRAAFKSGIDVDRAGHLYSDLCLAQESLVVANYLHLIYLATPYDMADQVKPTWMIYLNQISSLLPHELKVASLVGISEAHITKKVTGRRSHTKVDEFTVNRFYLTLVLYDLWKQKSVWDVSLKYQLPRGFVQNLLTSASSFASCIAHFCKELEEFWAYQDLMVNFVRKLSYCVSMELIPLMEVPGVKQSRAKHLFKAGYNTLTKLSYADPEGLMKIIEHLPRRAAKQIVASAKLLLTEKAEALREEADELVATPKSEG